MNRNRTATAPRPVTGVNLMDITPALASEMLEHNVGNRLPRRRQVEALVNAIREGRWRVTHQGIAFDAKGNLLDGQHRLLAIVEAGVPVKCYVTTGLPHEAREVIDLHARRTMADVVELHPDRLLNQWICRALRGYAVLTQPEGRAKSTDPRWFREMYAKYGDALRWVAATQKPAQRVLGRQDVGAAFMAFRHAHPAEAEAFYTQFVSGEGLVRGSPILLAREMFLTNALRQASTDATHYWKLIRAQQALLSGELLVKLYQASEDWLGNENPVGAMPNRKAKS